MGVMLVCPREFDVALCGITEENAALGFSLLGFHWLRTLNIGLLNNESVGK